MIGITPDVVDRNGRLTCRVADAYADRVARAGGVPVVLSPSVGLIGEYLGRLDGFVFTGGDDPIMEDFGAETHSSATRVHPHRQAFEIALLRALAERPTPVLGVCLGMQYMGLLAGARLDQHMPDSMGGLAAARHWDTTHPVRAEAGFPFGEGSAQSTHRQRLRDGGTLTVLARSDDGVIEAVGDPRRPFHLGVQWHPERTEGPLGQPVFEGLVRAAGGEGPR